MAQVVSDPWQPTIGVDVPVASLADSVRAALDELAGLAPGWDGYDGLPADQAAVEHALRFLEAVGDCTQIVPDVVPLSDGGVQLEWYVGTFEVDVMIAPDRSIEVYFECKIDGRAEEIFVEPDLDVSQVAPLLRELRR